MTASFLCNGFFPHGRLPISLPLSPKSAILEQIKTVWLKSETVKDMKRKFRVRINGKNFIMDLGEGPKESGFYTNRYVEAADEEEAENNVIESIRNDKRLKMNIFNKRDNPPILYAEEITEIESFDGISVPGKGYTFCTEKKI